MPKDVTTIRIQPDIRRAVLRQVKKSGMTFSNIVNLLLQAYLDGTVHVGVTQYPKGYLEKLHKEADALRKASRAGKTKVYSSAKELFDDLLDRK